MRSTSCTAPCDINTDPEYQKRLLLETMSHPVIWPSTVWFYPIGNTPAACLTQDIPPEEDANILLLGCGDPRHILYTLHSNRDQSLNGRKRRFDFTCCDSEPAVLARNVLLFTLVLDGHPDDLIWEIFFHFKITRQALSLLQKQSAKLVTLTTSSDDWNASDYSAHLEFADSHTLSQVHTLFQSYSDPPSWSAQKSRDLWSQFRSLFRDQGSDTCQVPKSLAPYFKEGYLLITNIFERFWRTGTTSRNDSEATCLNPTFVYTISSGDRITVHYGTHPLGCFHLAAAFLSSASQVTEDDVVCVATSQFREWCSSFYSIRSPPSVVIRFFAGDAMAFCHTLAHLAAHGRYSKDLHSSPYKSQTITLDGDPYVQLRAPLVFNVIDSSNLVDHLGLLNVLSSIAPLLKACQVSTFYTETLYGLRDRGLLDHLFMDASVSAMLLGVTPWGCHERLSSSDTPLLTEGKGLHQSIHRNAWKSVPSPAVTIDPNELATILFDTYLCMFAHEDLSHQFKMAESADPQKSLSLLKQSRIVHYHRASLVALIQIVKQRVTVGWQTTIDSVLDAIMGPQGRKLILGTNFYQELCALLHLNGIYTVDSFHIQPERKGVFSTWRSVPPIVCVVFSVPRDRFRVLDETPNIGTPVLEMGFRGTNFHNLFSSIHIVCGKLHVTGSGEDATAWIEEDEAGLSGDAPVLVSAWVTSYSLIYDHASTKISIQVHSTQATRPLIRRLGPECSLFKADLLDSSRVNVLSTRPGLPNELREHRSSVKTAIPNESVSTTFKYADSSKEIRYRWDSPDLESAQIEIKRISPFDVGVFSGSKLMRSLHPPIPVNHAQSRCRIARRSGWIEIVLPLAEHFDDPLKCLVFAPSDAGQPTLGGAVHRVSLDDMPVIQGDLSWVKISSSLMFSERETQLRKTDQHHQIDALTCVKETLLTIFIKLDLEKACPRAVGLAAPDGIGVFTIIVILDLRFDFSSQTLLADTCVLPITDSLLNRYGQRIASLNSSGKMLIMDLPAIEVEPWSYLLPAFVERCRTRWTHKATCEYKMKGRLPLSVSPEDNPLCACGEGIHLGKLGSEWSQLAPFMTRAAICPLFALPWIGPLTKGLKAHMANAGNPPSNACASCDRPPESGKTHLTCARCKSARYCGQDCQKAHWKAHKLVCKAPSASK